MPETLDSGGTPEFKELPAMHIPPTTGKDSQKPSDPSSLTGPTAKGGDKAPAPMGTSGAPPIAGGAGGGAGGKPPVQQPVQQTPEQKLNEDSLDALRQEIHKIVKRDDVKDVDSVLDGLLNDGWKPQRIDTLIDETESKDVGKLFENVLNKEYKKEEEADKEGVPTQLPPAGKETTLPTQDTTKKPDNDQTGVNLKQTKTVIQNYKRGGQMSKKVILSDGTLLIKEAKNVSEIISGISLARRKVEAALNKYVNTKIALAGMDALGMGGGMPPMGGMGGMESADSLLGLEKDEPKKSGLMSIIDNLKDVVEELMDFLGKGEETKLDESISAPDAMSLDTEIGAGKGILDKVKKEGPAADKKKESPEKDKGAPPFGKKDDDEKKPPFGKKDEEQDKASVTAAAGDTKAEGGDPMKATMGGKADKKKEEKKEKKAGEECEGEESEETEEESEAAKKKEGASSVIDKIMQRVAEMKQANLYPFKDLNKQQVDNINAETASSQASTINKEISGGKHAEKESIAPKGISTTNPTVSTGSPNNSKSVKSTNPKKAEAEEDGSAKISIEAAERIKQHSIENAVSKAKLAVELASRQQLKGLIENPLKIAFVKNMVEAGIDNEVAEAITHNAFLDGYQAAQQLIIKEAFEIFMEKDLKDFVKVAEFTEAYMTKEGSQAPAEGDNNSQVKTASVVETEAPLRGTQVSKDRKEEFKTYWSTVANERFSR